LGGSKLLKKLPKRGTRREEFENGSGKNQHHRGRRRDGNGMGAPSFQKLIVRIRLKRGRASLKNMFRACHTGPKNAQNIGKRKGTRGKVEIGQDRDVPLPWRQPEKAPKLFAKQNALPKFEVQVPKSVDVQKRDTTADSYFRVAYG